MFILAGNNEILESLDEFEILPDLTTDHRDRTAQYGVVCLLTSYTYNAENGVSALSWLYSIQSTTISFPQYLEKKMDRIQPNLYAHQY